jgi:hypothetical protein
MARGEFNECGEWEGKGEDALRRGINQDTFANEITPVLVREMPPDPSIGFTGPLKYRQRCRSGKTWRQAGDEDLAPLPKLLPPLP